RCELSRTAILGWVANACANRDRFGFTRRTIVAMRELLARKFPNKRVALRRHLALLKNMTVAPFRRAAGNVARPKPELKTGAPMPSRLTDEIDFADVGAGDILHLRRIAQQKLESAPYQWAFIDQLFSAEGAALLAAS